MNTSTLNLRFLILATVAAVAFCSSVEHADDASLVDSRSLAESSSLSPSLSGSSTIVLSPGLALLYGIWLTIIQVTPSFANFMIYFPIFAPFYDALIVVTETFRLTLLALLCSLYPQECPSMANTRSKSSKSSNMTDPEFLDGIADIITVIEGILSEFVMARSDENVGTLFDEIICEVLSIKYSISELIESKSGKSMYGSGFAGIYFCPMKSGKSGKMGATSNPSPYMKSGKSGKTIIPSSSSTPTYVKSAKIQKSKSMETHVKSEKAVKSSKVPEIVVKSEKAVKSSKVPEIVVKSEEAVKSSKVPKIVG